MKKRKCMANGGMPQERAKMPDETPEWKKSLAAAWQAIAGDAPKRDKPATADSLGDTARRIQDRKMENMKSARYKDGKVPDPEEVMRRMAAKYGGAAAVSTEPKQAIAQPKPAPSQQRTMSENIQNRNDQLQQVMDYDKRKFATGGMPGISRDGNSFYGERDTQSAGAVPAIPGKADPGIVSSVMGGIKPLAVSTAATPSNLVPTQVQGLAASGGFAGVSPAQEVAATPTETGNVFANPQAGNMLTSSNGQTMAEKAQAAGINPNAAYRPGSAQDPYASGLSSVTPAQRIAGSNATAAALAPNQPVPQLAPNPLDVRSSRQKRGFADGGMARQRFEGEGGPREDKIPVKVAGEEIKVSNGEEVVILPAKTAQNPQAIAAISDVIEQSNDGRKPAMGMSQGGGYSDGTKPKVPQDIYAPVYDGISAAFPNTVQAGGNAIQATKQAISEGQIPAAIGQAGRGLALTAQGVLQDVNNSAAYALQAPANAIKAFATGDNAPIAVQPAQAGMAKAAQQAPMQQAPIGNEGRTQAIQSTNAALPQPKQAVAAPEPDNRPRDRHGNDMTETLRLRDELMRARVDNALSNLNATNPAYRQQGMAQLAALQQAGAIDTATAQRIGLSQSQEMDSKLKGQQIAQGGLAMQQAQELNALYAAHNAEQNPEKRALIAEQIRVRTGKDRTDKPIAVDMGETISPDGTLKSKNPNVLYDPNTRQVIPLGVGQYNVAGRTLTKEDQAKLGPALKQQGMTLEQYAKQHGFNLGA